MSASGARSGDLRFIAFFETARVSFVTSLRVVAGAYLIVGDLDLSCQLVHWREKVRGNQAASRKASRVEG